MVASAAPVHPNRPVWCFEAGGRATAGIGTWKEVYLMTESSTTGGSLRGHTTGSAQRPAEQLAGASLRFDLAAESTGLKQESAWQSGDRNSKTLVKEGALRVVLTALRGGAKLAGHTTTAPITIQTYSGHLQVHLPDQTVDLPAGQMLALQSNVQHQVEATEESVFLLTLAFIDAGNT
jgi:quercetin dioxygenase-like cupin family protein